MRFEPTAPADGEEVVQPVGGDEVPVAIQTARTDSRPIRFRIDASGRRGLQHLRLNPYWIIGERCVAIVGTVIEVANQMKQIGWMDIRSHRKRFRASAPGNAGKEEHGDPSKDAHFTPEH
ncbi:hypothetical protein LBMAG53_38830 [Planctomycetota bacterium]|nr:hypothetical protein LBMAG53_38830 [Planctomycetota bacterium]